MATKTETVRIRMEPDVKQAAEAIFKQLGLSVSDAVGLFYRSVKQHKGLPFEAKIPNKTTRKAMQDAMTGSGMKTYKNVEEFRRSLGLD